MNHFSERAASCALLTLALFIVPGCPQSRTGGNQGAITFSKSYGTSRSELATDGIGTPDDGYVFVGSYGGRTVGGLPVDEDLWVTKLDALGDVEWSTVYRENQAASVGASEHVVMDLLTERQGGGFYTAGVLDREIDGVTSGSPVDLMVTRLGGDGTTNWSTRVAIDESAGIDLWLPDSGTREEARALLGSSDGGVWVGILASWTVLIANSNLVSTSFDTVTVEAPFVVNLDSFGAVRWTRSLDEDTLGVPGYLNGGMHFAETTGGGLFIAIPGLRSAEESGYVSTYEVTRLTRLNSEGQTVWTRLVQDFVVSDVERYVRPEIGGAEAFVLIGTFPSGGDGTRELRTIDATGNETNRIALSDFDEALEAATLQDGATRSFCVAGMASAPGGVSQVRLETFQSTSADLVVPSGSRGLNGATEHLALRDFSEGGIAGFEVLAGSLNDPERSSGDTIAARIQSNAAEISTLSIAEPVTALADWTTLGGRRHAGWVDGSTDYWTWRSNPNFPDSFEMFLERREQAGALVFERRFNPGLERRVERAVQVALIEDSFNPDDWELVVLGQVAWNVAQNPPPPDEPESAWLLRLDRDGQIMSQMLYDEIQLSDLDRISPQLELRRSQSTLERAENGDVFIAGVVDGISRVIRIAVDGTIAWNSAPISGPEDGRIVGIEALEEGGVIAFGGDWLARIDDAGTQLWAVRTEFDTVGGVCQMENGALLVSGVSHFRGLHVSSYDLAGNLFWAREIAQGIFGADYDTVQAMAPAAGGGAVVACGVDALTATGIPGIGVSTWYLRLLEVSADGELIWSTLHGGLAEGALGGLSVLRDGGLLLSGRSDSFGERSEAWLLRTDSCGLVTRACNAFREGSELPPNSDSIAFTPSAFVPAGVSGAPASATINAFPTLATVQSVTDSVVVARQCSGFSKDAVASPNSHLLTVIVESGEGTVREIVPGELTARIICPNDCTALVSPDSVVQLRATPSAGFLNPVWIGGVCEDDPGGASLCSVLMDRDRVVRVAFPPAGGTPDLYDLTINFQGEGTGSVFVNPPGIPCTEDHLLEGVAEFGDRVFLTATGLNGSRFTGFGGVDSVDGNTAEVQFAFSDRTVTVNFE